jgi:hypothetical protein
VLSGSFIVDSGVVVWADGGAKLSERSLFCQ